MRTLLKKSLSLFAVIGLLLSASGFTIMGPPMGYQTPQLGYMLTNFVRDGVGVDIAAPKFLHSFYRWNLTNVTYAFDQSFIDYFGPEGVKAVDGAVAILNALPRADEIDLNQFPLETRLWNPQAEQAGLLDVKSYVLSMLLEQLGLGNPERYAWSLYYRAAAAAQTNYYVISQNYDPFTLQPTGRVNGIYYSYNIREELLNGAVVADAYEKPVTFTDLTPYSSVASGEIGHGHAYAGLTRDDVGGLKYLLSTNTLAVEGLLNTVTQYAASSLLSYGWVPYLGGLTNLASNGYFSSSNYYSSITLQALTNFANLTNGSNFIQVGIRGGVGKVRFTKVKYDSIIGNSFTDIATNDWVDVVLVTNKLVQQKVRRVITQPDILFVADHLGFVNTIFPDGTIDTAPILATRTDSSAWINNDTLNGTTTEGGPGVITPPGGGGTNAPAGAATTTSIRLTLTSDLGGLMNSNPYFLDEQWATLGSLWGSFDNTPKEPVVYPVYQQLTVQQLLNWIKNFTNTPSWTPTTTSQLSQ